jgi:DGQHR domain-containing protein
LSLTVPSDVLADTCFVTTRYEDPLEGFQRRLDEKRATEIAEYIDSDFGTIPNAVILSAQADAKLTIKPGGRALRFLRHPKAFLVLDGQHRVWGYKKARSHLRVPVVIYQNLTRREETRLFIDINTKQRPVPNELLLDIKQLADLETDIETLLRELFDNLNTNSQSALSGMLSPHEKARGKLTRTTFNSALAIIDELIVGKSSEELFNVINPYLAAVDSGLKRLKAEDCLVNPNVFKAIVAFFPEVASKVKDRFDGVYTKDNFVEVLGPVFSKLTRSKILSTGRSYKALQAQFSSALTKSFSL